MRFVDALMKGNKNFDMLFVPHMFHGESGEHPLYLVRRELQGYRRDRFGEDRNLWTHTDLGSFNGTYTVEVPRHRAVLLTVQ